MKTEAVMAKHVKRSVVPIYLIGITWLVYSLAFSLRGVMDYVLCAVVSAVVFVIGKAVFPDKAFTVPGEDKQEKTEKKEPEKPKSTGNPEIDALIAARAAAKKEKNWAEADRVRDELKARGIEIIDTPQGTKWKRV